MRRVSFSIVILLGLWVIAGMPVPGVAVKPLSPNPEIPTFAEASRDLNTVQEPARMGQVEQKPEMSRMRQAVLDTAERLKQDPCNKAVRQELAAAAIPFLESMIGKRRLPAETVTINGKQHTRSNGLNAPVFQAINDALHEGRLKSEDLPPGLNPTAFAGILEGMSEHTCRS